MAVEPTEGASFAPTESHRAIDRATALALQAGLLERRLAAGDAEPAELAAFLADAAAAFRALGDQLRALGDPGV